MTDHYILQEADRLLAEARSLRDQRHALKQRRELERQKLHQLFAECERYRRAEITPSFAPTQLHKDANVSFATCYPPGR